MSACPLCATSATGGFWSNLLTTDFVPRSQCVGGRGEIIWTHVAADAAIAVAYYSIPIALVYFVRRRKDVAFGWMFMLFAAFILACGTTHVMNILAFWYPMYRLDGVIKAGTGGISLVTAWALWPLIPKALAMPSPSQLKVLNTQLNEEMGVRRAAEARLEQAKSGLEIAVEARTRELAEANHKLSARIAEMESVYEGVPVGLCLLDAQKRIARLNQRLAVMLGSEPAEPLGKELASVSPEIAAVVDLSRPVDAGGGLDPIVRVSSRQTPGMESVWLVTVRPVRDSAGSVAGASIAVKDLTERTKLESQLQQSQKMEAVGQLASGIAHDINNSLTAIYGYLSLALVNLEKTHESTPYLEKIAIAAEQASQTTKSLLTFARPTPPRREPLELAPVVQHAMSMARGVLPARVKVDADVERGEGVWIQADPTQIQQVLLNLAINARDAMPTGGTLKASVFREGDMGKIEVSDTGIGMTPEVLSKIFDPFFTTKPRGEGTGLGLAVVQGIVGAHNGKITVRSSPNAGTTFTIEFPVILAPGSRQAGEVLQTPQRGAGTVLLVEDNSHVRDLLAMGLRASGFSVVEVGTSEQFLEAAERMGSQVTAYVLDIDIPGRLGTECLEMLRAKGQRTPAVFISGGKADDVKPDALTKVLAKPFHSSDLIRALNSAIAASGEPGAGPSVA